DIRMPYSPSTFPPVNLKCLLLENLTFMGLPETVSVTLPPQFVTTTGFAFVPTTFLKVTLVVYLTEELKQITSPGLIPRALASTVEVFAGTTYLHVPQLAAACAFTLVESNAEASVVTTGSSSHPNKTTETNNAKNRE